MAGFDIDITANTKSVQAGAKDIEGAFEDVADSLDGLASAADKSGDKVSDSLGGATKDVAKEAEKLERKFRDALDGVEKGSKDAAKSSDKISTSFKDAADKVKRESKSAGDAIGTDIKRGTDKAGEGLDDFKSEANSTARESAASFDGSAESIVDSFQEIAANAFAGFGPAGAAAGFAAALGIGVISTALQDGGEDTEALKEKVANLTTELIEAGKEGGPSLEYIVDRMKELATETDDGATSLEDLRKAADDSGSSFEDLAQAYSGNVDGLKDLWRAADRRQAQMQEDLKAAEQAHSASADELKDMQDKIDAQGRYRDYLGEAKGIAEDAAEAERNYAEAGGAALEQRQTLLDSLNEAYDEAAGASSGFYNEETKLFDVSGYVAAMEAREKSLQDYQTSIYSSGLSAEAIDFLNTQGIDAAAAMLSGYQSATPEVKAQLNGYWSQAGAENSGEYGAAFENGLPTEVQGPTVHTEADTEPATQSIRVVENWKPVTQVGTKADTKPARDAIQQVADAAYSATITANAATGSAQAEVDRFVRRNDGRTFTITQLVKDRNGNPVS